MSRCILVMGIPRSGSSCVAGVLHKLGVNMGAGHFQPRDKFNPRGYFEDLRWRMLTQQLTGRGYSLKAASLKSVPKGIRQKYHWLARECSRNPLWGIKDPWFCFVPGRAAWNQIRAVGTEVYMVVVNRDLDASRCSVARHLRTSYKGQYRGAKRIVETWKAAMDARVAEFDGKIVEIEYEQLVAMPSVYVPALWAFVSQGLDVEEPGDIDEIIEWVTPKLKHY